MAKKTSAQRADKASKNAGPTTRDKARRASGAQHRQKARIRKTAREIDTVLNFVNYGRWPWGKGKWFTVYDPSPYEEGRFSPLLAALHLYVVAKLESLGSLEQGAAAVWRETVHFEYVLEPSEIEEATRPDCSNEILEKLRAACALCAGTLLHLNEIGGSKLIYRCSTCRRWFVASKHDPRDPRQPYCSKSCWPSSSFRDPVAPGRRVQSTKTKTPPRGV
jgi:hypothetical protein